MPKTRNTSSTRQSGRVRKPTVQKRGRRTIKEIAPAAPLLEDLGGDRERWLTRAAHLMWPWVVQAAAWGDVPLRRGSPPAAISCSWPPGRVVADLSTTTINAAGEPTVTISPVVGQGWHLWDDRARQGEHSCVAAALVLHELVHLAAGADQGHGGSFLSIARALGFRAPMADAVPGPDLSTRIEEGVVARLGAYPHVSERPVPADVPGHRKQRQRRGAYACERCGRKLSAARGLRAKHLCDDGGEGLFKPVDPAFR